MRDLPKEFEQLTGLLAAMIICPDNEHVIQAKLVDSPFWCPAPEEKDAPLGKEFALKRMARFAISRMPLDILNYCRFDISMAVVWEGRVSVYQADARKNISDRVAAVHSIKDVTEDGHAIDVQQVAAKAYFLELKKFILNQSLANALLYMDRTNKKVGAKDAPWQLVKNCYESRRS